MRYLLTPFSLVLAFNVLATSRSFAAEAQPASDPKPAIRLTSWKNDIGSDVTDRNTELPSLLSPVDSSSQIERAPVDVQQNIPVEAVPAPTAVASGMLVLTGLAAVRIVRKIRFA